MHRRNITSLQRRNLRHIVHPCFILQYCLQCTVCSDIVQLHPGGGLCCTFHGFHQVPIRPTKQDEILKWKWWWTNQESSSVWCMPDHGHAVPQKGACQGSGFRTIKKHGSVSLLFYSPTPCAHPVSCRSLCCECIEYLLILLILVWNQVHFLTVLVSDTHQYDGH